MSVVPIDKVLYTAKAHTTGGREGGSRTSDGQLDVKLAIPGSHAAGTNPEQLFAAGWSACYLSAIKIVAGSTKIRLSPDAAVDAEVDLGTNNGGYFIQARLDVSLRAWIARWRRRLSMPRIWSARTRKPRWATSTL